MWRKRLFPRTITDFAASLFLVVMFQVFYWFEVFMVLPMYFADNNILYICHCILSTYLLVNVVGNYVAVYVTDTSIEKRFLSSELHPKWKICEVCECVTPPRSWHCQVCNTCILKRDHHCNFTSCCIGHHNHRYFMMFLFYLSISAIYCTYFNAYYLWKFTSFTTFGIFRLVFPLAIFLFGNDMTILQFYRLICVISIVGMVAVTTIFIYHFNNICKGWVMYEKAKNIRDYDLGSAKENIRVVLGNRWYLTWVSPFIFSELPNDGIYWDTLKLYSSKGK